MKIQRRIRRLHEPERNLLRRGLASLVLIGYWTVGPAADEPWKDLFGGKTLKGWVQEGGKARYEVVEGQIVGSTVLNTPNSFLYAEKAYGDR